MQITFDTNNLSETDLAILRVVVGGEAAAPAPAPAAKKAASAPKAQAKPKAEAEPEPEPEPEADDAEQSEDLMAKAVALATNLVRNGEAPRVKKALNDAGAKRVSEVGESDLPAFIKTLS